MRLPILSTHVSQILSLRPQVLPLQNILTSTPQVVAIFGGVFATMEIEPLESMNLMRSLIQKVVRLLAPENGKTLLMSESELMDAASCVRDVDKLSRKALEELAAQERALREDREKNDSIKDYLHAIIDAVKQHVEWIADPNDPSTSLENIYDPEEIGRLVQRRYRELQNQVGHFSTLNSGLQKTSQEESKEAARLKDELHSQTQAAQNMRSEKDKLVRMVKDKKDELSKQQPEIQRLKDQAQVMRKDRDGIGATLKDVQTNLRTIQEESDCNKIGMADTEKKNLILQHTNAKPQTGMESLQAQLRTPPERSEKDLPTVKEMQCTIADLKAELETAKSNAVGVTRLRMTLQAVRTEKQKIADANDVLTAKITSLEAQQSTLAAQVERREILQTQEVNSAASLKAELEAVKSQLRNEFDRAQVLNKEKENLVKELGDKLRTVREQTEEREAIFYKRLSQAEKSRKEESTKHEATQAGLKLATGTKNTLSRTNKNLVVEIKALRSKLEDEKRSSERVSSEHRGQLSATSVKYKGVVCGLHQNLNERRNQLEQVKKDCEKRLQEQETACIAKILRLEDGVQAALRRASEQQIELQDLRNQHDARQRALKTLQQALSKNTAEDDELCAILNTMIAKRKSAFKEVFHVAEKCMTDGPEAAKDPFGMDQATQQEESLLEPGLSGHDTTAHPIRDPDGHPDPLTSSKQPSTSKKRTAAEANLSDESTSATSKRSCQEMAETQHIPPDTNSARASIPSVAVAGSGTTLESISAHVP